jgi:hypothetical protein
LLVSTPLRRRTTGVYGDVAGFRREQGGLLNASSGRFQASTRFSNSRLHRRTRKNPTIVIATTTTAPACHDHVRQRGADDRGPEGVAATEG